MIEQPEVSYKNMNKTPQALIPVDIFNYRPVISKNDNIQGEIIRYFCRQTNHTAPTGIVEINKEKYNELQNIALYTTVAVRWIIRGRTTDLTNENGTTILKDGVATINKKSIMIADKTLNGISSIITDYLRFWQGP